jgi:Uncharacterized phage-encoded protein
MKFGEKSRMSSLEIAELCEKRHDHVVRDIRNMVENLDIPISPQIWGDYTDDKGRKYPCAYLDFELTTTLMTGYRVELRHKVVKRWMELERGAGQLPQSLPEALRLAADLAEKVEVQSRQLEEARPAVEFRERYVEASSLKNIRDVAKILGIKEKTFVEMLLDWQIVFRQGRTLLPYANWQHKGYFEVKTGEKYGHAWHHTKFTPKGIAWIADRVAKKKGA